MQLVLITLRSGTSLKIAYIRPLVCNNKSSLKLACTLGIYTEVAAKLHRTTGVLWNIAERTVAEHCRVKCREIVVTHRDNRCKIFLHQIGIIPYSLRERAENHTLLSQGLPESSLYRDRIKHRINGHSCKHVSLMKRNTQFLKSLLQLRVNLSNLLLRLRRSIIDDILIINLRNIQMRPLGHLHFLPPFKRLQTELQQPLRLTLL